MIGQSPAHTPGMQPATCESALSLLEELGAPDRLLRHAHLVGEAAELLLAAVALHGADIDPELVRIGVALHDVGKVEHPHELEHPGSEHEPAGQALLLARGVSAEVARMCLSHARWDSMSVSFEELLVALSDKLWKGVRKQELEERVIAELASQVKKDKWELFVPLDSVFERIAADGEHRLARSLA